VLASLNEPAKMNKKKYRIDALLLAAGSATRFGSDKRLYLIDGVPILQRTLLSIIDTVNTVMVVLRSDDNKILPKLLGNFLDDRRVIVLLLDNPESGIGSNLARAVQQLDVVCDGVLVMLADMPYLRPQTVQAVVDAYNPEKIIAPVFTRTDGTEQQGHPVLFSRRFFSELSRLDGDSGARSVMQRNKDSVIFIRVLDEGVLRDLDVPEG
jgi:molybdenum cofactor cytidylyltransferase